MPKIDIVGATNYFEIITIFFIWILINEIVKILNIFKTAPYDIIPFVIKK